VESVVSKYRLSGTDITIEVLCTFNLCNPKTSDIHFISQNTNSLFQKRKPARCKTCKVENLQGAKPGRGKTCNVENLQGGKPARGKTYKGENLQGRGPPVFDTAQSNL